MIFSKPPRGGPVGATIILLLGAARLIDAFSVFNPATRGGSATADPSGEGTSTDEGSFLSISEVATEDAVEHDEHEGASREHESREHEDADEEDEDEDEEEDRTASHEHDEDAYPEEDTNASWGPFGPDEKKLTRIHDLPAGEDVSQTKGGPESSSQQRKGSDSVKRVDSVKEPQRSKKTRTSTTATTAAVAFLETAPGSRVWGAQCKRFPQEWTYACTDHELGKDKAGKNLKLVAACALRVFASFNVVDMKSQGVLDVLVEWDKKGRLQRAFWGSNKGKKAAKHTARNAAAKQVRNLIYGGHVGVI